MNEPVFCICRQPDDHTLMVQCNYCDEWFERETNADIFRFHCRCIKMSSRQLESLQEYKCDLCILKSGSNSSSSSNCSNGKNIPKQTNRRRKDKKEKQTADPRQSVRQGLYKTLKPFSENAWKHSMEIEEAMFQAFSKSSSSPCGQQYRSKYRSLSFNLNDPKNDRLRNQIFSGALSCARLVQLSSFEMANADLERTILAVRQQSVEQAIVEKIAPNQDGIKESIFWKGQVILADVCRFAALVTPITTFFQLEWLPTNMYLAGRLSSSSALSYLEEISKTSKSRELHLLRLKSAHSSAEEGLLELIQYLDNQDKVAVLTPTRMISDCYLISNGRYDLSHLFPKETFVIGKHHHSNDLFLWVVAVIIHKRFN